MGRKEKGAEREERRPTEVFEPSQLTSCEMVEFALTVHANQKREWVRERGEKLERGRSRTREKERGRGE